MDLEAGQRHLAYMLGCVTLPWEEQGESWEQQSNGDDLSELDDLTLPLGRRSARMFGMGREDDPC